MSDSRAGRTHLPVLALLLASIHGSSADQQGWSSVWPVPRNETSSGSPLTLSPSFAVHYTGKSIVATAAAVRYTEMLQKKRNSSVAVTVGAALTTLSLFLESADDTLTNWTVNESYTLSVQSGTAVLRAPTPFGALHGLETFYQLVTVAVNGEVQLPRDSIEITDAPSFPHRSVLIDLGRRLYPLPFVRSIIDAMSYAKLNVLHLHLSDFGRFAWESKVFPELNVGYLGDGRFWKQQEVRDLISYARLRGVRLVPEIELSTHAAALLPLAATQGLAFCNLSFPNMLFDDPEGKTVGVLKKLLTELAGLFSDDVLHVGMDEAQCHYSDPANRDPLDVGMCGVQDPPRCNQETVQSLQHKVLKWVAEELRPARRPMAWHNVITDCGDLNGCDVPGHPPNAAAGVLSTIVEVYSTGGFSSSSALLLNSTASGYLTVMADAARLYLDTGSPDPAVYYTKMWFDIAGGLPDKLRERVLGGSLSLWGDSYCSGTVECGGWAYCPGAPWPKDSAWPTGGAANSCVSADSWMQDQMHDDTFIQSAGGLLFPRANVGAGAFWNFRVDLAPNSSEVLTRTKALAASMSERKVLGLCEDGCSCSFGSRCGKPYNR